MANVKPGDMATRGGERVRVLAVSEDGGNARVTGPRGEERVATNDLRYLPVAYEIDPRDVEEWAL